jgi:hypothetical protein
MYSIVHIGEAARLLGCTPEHLRALERRSRIPTARRDYDGRIYSEFDIALLRAMGVGSRAAQKGSELVMPGGFKDLSALHIASVESGQPEMFHKVLEVAMWRAEHEISSSSSNSLGGDGDDEESRTLRVEKFSNLPKYTGARPSVIRGIFPKGFPTSIYGEGGIAKSTIALHMCMSIASGFRDSEIPSPEEEEVFGSVWSASPGVAVSRCYRAISDNTLLEVHSSIAVSPLLGVWSRVLENP